MEKQRSSGSGPTHKGDLKNDRFICSVKTTDRPAKLEAEAGTFIKAESDATFHNKEAAVIFYEPKIDRITGYIKIHNEWEKLDEFELYDFLHGDF